MDLALNNLQRLIHHKTQTTNTNIFFIFSKQFDDVHVHFVVDILFINPVEFFTSALVDGFSLEFE